jgi:hypothetical protein
LAICLILSADVAASKSEEVIVSGTPRLIASDAMGLIALRLPHRVAFRVEAQFPAVSPVLNFILRLPVGNRLFTHSAELSRSVACTDPAGPHHWE